MKIKVETEKKYYCMEPEKLIKKAEILGFTDKSNNVEIDEYFTDIDSEFIRNRTCLRIRQKNNSMEITYKGKSNSLLGQYCKLENNITIDKAEYSNISHLFSSLGFYSYVEVEKNRSTYVLNGDKYSYSIMIDKLPNIGGFVEFEIMSEKDDAKKNELKKFLDEFVGKFSDLNLKEATKPYRDIVADSIYEKLIGKNEKKDLFISVDEEIIGYEKDFFKKYKDKISEICGSSIKWGYYKKNDGIEEKIVSLIDEYLDNLVFDNNQLMVTIELLKKINYKKRFITKTNKLFFTHLFGKLNVELNNVLYLKDETVIKILKSNDVDVNKVIMINSKSIKEINSELLIIINNENN